MGLFWFLVAVILLIALLKKSTPPEATDRYANGYEDGYQAFMARAEELTGRGVLSNDQFQALVGESVNEQVSQENMEYQPVPAEASFAAEVAIPPREISAEERAARSLRNLNTILYMASFLLVSAGALFVGAAMPDVVKLIGVWLIITVFYGAGIVLHLTVDRLRPAATAFLGTGLALVPFGGVALAQYTSLSGAQAWLVTSLVGFGAYLLAALRLNSQVVSYLTMAFVLAFVGSAAATVDTGLVGQFIVFIGVSLLTNILAVVRPKWLPRIFSQPIEHTGQVVTPIVLMASVVLGLQGRLGINDFEIISCVALVHYLVAWLQTRTLVLEATIRGLISLTVLIFVADLSNGHVATIGLALAIVAVLQQGYSLAMVLRPERSDVERQWITGLFVVQFFAMLLWQLSVEAAVFNAIGLFLLGGTSLAAALCLRSVKVAMIGLVVSLVLPFAIARQVFDPALAWWSLAGVFVVLSAGALWGYGKVTHRSADLRTFMTAGYVAYAVLALLAAGWEGNALVSSLIYLAVAGVMQAASHVARRLWLQLVAAALIFAGVWYLNVVYALPIEWQPLFAAGVTAGVLWLAAGMYGTLGKFARMSYSLAPAQLALATSIWGVAAHSSLVNRWTVAVFMVGAVVSLAARVYFGKRLLTSASAIASTSYAGLFLLAVIAAFGVSQQWAVGVLSLGVGLFTIASYIEKLPPLQLVASTAALAALAVVAPLIAVPSDWFILFVFGGAAILHYAATGLHAAFHQPSRQLLMLGAAQTFVFMIVCGGLGADQITQVTATLLLVAAVISFGLRWWNRDRSIAYESIFQLSYVAYFVVGVALALTLGLGWGVAALAIGALLFWGASYAERAPWVMIVGNLLFVVAAVRFWLWADLSLSWFVLGVGWILAVVFYFGYGIYTGLKDSWRQQLMLWSTWMSLGFASFMATLTQGFTLAVATMLVALAATMGIDAYRRRSWALGEGAIYLANIAFQRLLGSLYPELNVVFYAHLWAAVVALVALIRRRGVRSRLVVAMIFVSFSSGLYALMHGGFYQMLFLAEHLALLVIGAIRQKSWAIWWGIAASAVAILYFLREYTFLWLGFLGLVLIAIVVWRLMRTASVKL